MRASRLLAIMIMLQLRGRQTAEALAAEFEISVRTVYRDIDALSAAGVPVYGDRGPGGGFELIEGYRTRLTGLSTAEIEALFMIGLPGPAAALGLGAEAAVAGNKLLAALSPGSSLSAARLGTRFHLDPIDWYRASEPVPNLPVIARAVLDQHQLRMRYASWTGTRDRCVEPLGVVLKAGTWYLVGRGDGMIRSFRVSNIRSLTVTSTVFERPASFDLAGFWSAGLVRFEAGLRPNMAVVDASPEGLRRLARLGDFAARAARAAEPVAGSDWARVCLPIESIEQAALMLLGVGPEIAVVEPQSLQGRVAELARRVAEMTLPRRPTAV